MAGLIDISPVSKTVPINGVDIDVTGVSAHDIARILSTFPEVRKAIDGAQVDAWALINCGVDAVAEILAAGTGASGDKKALEAARRLVVEDQVDLLEAIIEATLPRSKSVGPFVQRLAALGVLGDLGDAGAA